MPSEHRSSNNKDNRTFHLNHNNNSNSGYLVLIGLQPQRPCSFNEGFNLNLLFVQTVR
jgi:hypothetical protein